MIFTISPFVFYIFYIENLFVIYSCRKVSILIYHHFIPNAQLGAVKTTVKNYFLSSAILQEKK